MAAGALAGEGLGKPAGRPAEETAGGGGVAALVSGTDADDTVTAAAEPLEMVLLGKVDPADTLSSNV